MPTFVTFSLGKEELDQFETQKIQKKIQLILVELRMNSSNRWSSRWSVRYSKKDQFKNFWIYLLKLPNSSLTTPLKAIHWRFSAKVDVVFFGVGSNHL